MAKTVSVIIGSLRKESYARKIALNVMKMFPEGYEPKILEIRDLPLYDCDYDDDKVEDKPVPEIYKPFRKALKESAGVLFVTCENNRTVPACVKNAVDIGSKPASDAAWKGLPVGIMSHSVGTMGGYSSQKNLRLALSYFDMPTPGQPEVFLAKSPELINDDGSFKKDSTREFLQDYVDRFVKIMDEVGRG